MVVMSELGHPPPALYIEDLRFNTSECPLILEWDYCMCNHMCEVTRVFSSCIWQVWNEAVWTCMQGDSRRKWRQRAAWCSQESRNAGVHRALDFMRAVWGRNLLRSHPSWTSASRTTDNTFSTVWAVQCGRSDGTALATNSEAIRWRERVKTVLVCEGMYEEPWREAKVNSENTLAPV